MRGISWLAENRLASREGICALSLRVSKMSRLFLNPSRNMFNLWQCTRIRKYLEVRTCNLSLIISSEVTIIQWKPFRNLVPPSRHSYRALNDLEAPKLELPNPLPNTTTKQVLELESDKLEKYTNQFLEASQSEWTRRGLPRHRHRSNSVPTLSSRPKTTAKVLSLRTQTILSVRKEVVQDRHINNVYCKVG